MPGAQLGGQLVEKFADFEHLGQFGDARVNFIGSKTFAIRQGKRDVLPDRKRIKQRSRLENHGDAAANFYQALFRPVGNVLAGHNDAARIGLEKTHNMLQGDRFSHAAAAHDDAGLARIDEEAHAVEHHVPVEGLGDVLKFDVMVAHEAVAPAPYSGARNRHC